MQRFSAIAPGALVRRSHRLALLAAFAVAGAGAQPNPAALRKFDAYVAKGVKDWSVPGLAVAIVHGDSVVFAKGYGVRTLGHPEPVDEHTLFAIGSTTKAMTATIMGMLVDAGQVRWDAPVIDYVPEFRVADPYVTRELTVRDLLTHRGGLPNTDFLWGDSANSWPTILHRLRFVKQAYGLRSSFIYQNVMYATAGNLEARLTETPWDALMRQRIFEPVGMSETVTSTKPLASLPDVATPHARLNDSVRVVPWRNLDNIGPAGSVNSSIHDMARWVRFVLDSDRVNGKRLVTASTYAEFFTPQSLVPPGEFYPTAREIHPRFVTYGLGWFMHDYRGQKVVMHTGSIDGMSAIIGLLPDQRLGVIVLANLDHAELRHALMLKVFDLYLGDTGRDWSADLLKLYGGLQAQAVAQGKARERERTADAAPTLPLARYAGTYSDSLLGAVIITAQQGKLQLRYGSTDFGDLEPWGPDTFQLKWHDPLAGKDLVTFALTSGGAVAELRVDGLGAFTRSPDTANAGTR